MWLVTPVLTLYAFLLAQYEDLTVNGKSVKFFWQAMEGFSNGRLIVVTKNLNRMLFSICKGCLYINMRDLALRLHINIEIGPINTYHIYGFVCIIY